MDTQQIAQSIINDRSTFLARKSALARFIAGADFESVVHELLPLVIAELRKPIYEGLGPFREQLWPAAAAILDDEIARARDERGV